MSPGSQELGLESLHLALECCNMKTHVRTVIVVKVNDEVEQIRPCLCHGSRTSMLTVYIQNEIVCECQ